ncbi:hypothetical protein ASG22_07425 [Chryseobacterium sp. Leaf405]|uniref:hypothetical protein n=1 Tax=Chryseobacterium sp. Leaf405 TaxID=1736367 RepID=UPI0006FE9D64|nr:hypothetical protein [Chryseobacterium sp. Leaf405]KQT23848.1 hypothetical protein ASG22_07425 [Chryseobacterium sp. Leaf405]
MLLPVNALNFIMNSPEFVNKMTQEHINPNFGLEVKMRLLPNAEQRYFYYDMYFDYGLPGKSLKDVFAKVRVKDDGSFEILQMKFD